MQLEEGASSPLTCQEFSDLMAGLSFDRLENIAVAVSGGGDSMALVLLLERWCKNNNVSLTILTVDHGLRLASNDEALRVAGWLSSLTVTHHILKWEGDKPTSNIQSAARNARYQLMGNFCADKNIKYLFLAHHMDDQAETFLLRLFRGSGVDGLSAMDSMSVLPVSGNDTIVVRPLLNIAKDRLLETLKVAGQEWIFDPSNNNENFARVKVRALLEQSNIDGLNSEKLSKTAQKMNRVRSLLDDLTTQAESDYVSVHPLGYAKLDKSFVETLHEEIALRLLVKIVKHISGGDYAPRYEKLLSLYNNIKSGNFSGQTLMGCLIFCNKTREIVFVRELSAVHSGIEITDEKQHLWDNRFYVNGNKFQGRVVAFSKDILQRITKETSELKVELYGQFDDHVLRDYVLPTLPCLVLTGGEVILPDLLFSEESQEKQARFSVKLKK
jgi:tRNA(Ile)-lysidine synthase